MVTHTDHSEHSVDVLVTEHGIADLRGKDPRQRAVTVIENCADPAYSNQLRDYLKFVKPGHEPLSFKACFANAPEVSPRWRHARGSMGMS